MEGRRAPALLGLYWRELYCCVRRTRWTRMWTWAMWKCAVWGIVQDQRRSLIVCASRLWTWSRLFFRSPPHLMVAVRCVRCGRRRDVVVRSASARGLSRSSGEVRRDRFCLRCRSRTPVCASLRCGRGAVCVLKASWKVFVCVYVGTRQVARQRRISARYTCVVNYGRWRRHRVRRRNVFPTRTRSGLDLGPLRFRRLRLLGIQDWLRT